MDRGNNTSDYVLALWRPYLESNLEDQTIYVLVAPYCSLMTPILT
jgi:hypothetical protein